MRLTFRTAVLAVLFVLSLSAAAQPRAIPTNDTPETARKLKLGKPVVVTGIEMALWEAEDDDPMCSGDTAHSIWFKFESPRNMDLTIHTVGTQLSYEGANGYHPAVEERVTVELFTPAFIGGELELRGCEGPSFDPYTPTVLHAVSVGVETAYIRVSVDPTITLLPPSQVRIQVLPYISELVENPGFYDGLTGWKVKKGSNDGVVTGDSNINGGFPAFVFTGNPGQNATLKQTIDVSGINFGKAATMDATAVYAHNQTDLEFIMRITVTYKDGTTGKFTYKETRTFPDLNPNLGYIAWYPLKTGKIKTVTVSIPFKETSGTLVISDVYVGIKALAPQRR